AAWRKTIAALIEVGRVLIEAKAAIPHGKFNRWITKHCPFGQRAAETLMRIAENPLLSNPQHAALLPCSWHTLGELDRLPEEELSYAIEHRLVRPDLKREEVREWLRDHVRSALGRRSQRRPVQKAAREQMAGRATRLIAAEIKKKLVAASWFGPEMNEE